MIPWVQGMQKARIRTKMLRASDRAMAIIEGEYEARAMGKVDSCKLGVLECVGWDWSAAYLCRRIFSLPLSKDRDRPFPLLFGRTIQS